MGLRKIGKMDFACKSKLRFEWSCVVLEHNTCGGMVVYENDPDHQEAKTTPPLGRGCFNTRCATAILRSRSLDPDSVELAT